MAEVDYIIGASQLRWTVTAVADQTVSALNDSPVAYKVAAWSNGAVYDPRSSVVSFSFTTSDVAPGAWITGLWSANEIGEYMAYINTGATGLGLITPQRGYVWMKIADNTPTPHETFVGMVGGIWVQ